MCYDLMKIRHLGIYCNEERNDLTELSDDEIDDGVVGFYGSLDALKKEIPDNWKQIAVECIFEDEAMAN